MQWHKTLISMRSVMVRTILMTLAFLFLWLSGVKTNLAGDPVYLGASTHADRSMDSIHHADWHDLLSRYVDRNGLVDYRTWKASQEDVRKLDDYLQGLSAANPSVAASQQARLAFWINAYNAVTVRGILREFPTSSIRNHTPRLFGYHIWKDLKLYVGGKPHSLDQIEHEILRKMNEPRIHFAIVCASLGCPRLRNEAYVADRIESQFESNAKDFFAQRRHFRHEAAERRFYLSAILDWFGEDFGENQAEVLSRIAKWLPTPEAVAAARTNDVSVSYLDYDWNLNQQ